MAVWIVRAGKYDEQEATDLKEGLVTVAWNDLGDLKEVVHQAKDDDDKARQGLKKLYEQEGLVSRRILFQSAAGRFGPSFIVSRKGISSSCRVSRRMPSPLAR